MFQTPSFEICDWEDFEKSYIKKENGPSNSFIAGEVILGFCKKHLVPYTLPDMEAPLTIPDLLFHGCTASSRQDKRKKDNPKLENIEDNEHVSEVFDEIDTNEYRNQKITIEEST